ncbi:MAG TPA: excinuclease ABC subunit C [Candidatus Kerfeldbacteria bacterium]|nr:excinuclease ABC subunit C [Candidatus Kerfeldbacteria bacterium]
MFYTYILRSLKDHSLYVGYTNDVQRRFIEHKQGKVISTKSKMPFELCGYFACQSSKKASDLEKYFKSGSGKAFIHKHLS